MSFLFLFPPQHREGKYSKAWCYIGTAWMKSLITLYNILDGYGEEGVTVNSIMNSFFI